MGIVGHIFERLRIRSRRRRYREGEVVSRFIARDIRRDILVVSVARLNEGFICGRVRTTNLLYLSRGLISEPKFGPIEELDIQEVWRWPGQVFGGLPDGTSLMTNGVTRSDGSGMTPVMESKEHWEQVYQNKKVTEVSWYRPHLSTSLRFIEKYASASSRILDVGAGASTLADDLLARGFQHIALLDISDTALSIIRQRLEGIPESVKVSYIVSEVTSFEGAPQSIDLWHDRAVFHFLTTPTQVNAYVEQAARLVRPGGTLVLATFSRQGPTKCSGLPIQQYDAEGLAKMFKRFFTLEESVEENHGTPAGATQAFVYVVLKRNEDL